MNIAKTTKRFEIQDALTWRKFDLQTFFFFKFIRPEYTHYMYVHCWYMVEKNQRITLIF